MPRQIASLPEFVENIRAEVLARDSDRQLLTRFIALRDESAFSALVQRHGPMLANLCRRWLGDAHLADDVVQATFLVLVRRAKSIRRRDSLGSWLYGVARRIARQAKLAESARSRREQRFAGRKDGEKRNLAWDELLDVLDEELRRLPDRYRSPLLLCYLQGRTQDEAATQLGWSLSTLRRRLEHGRALLHERLTRRGAAIGVGLVGSLIAPRALSAEFRQRLCSIALGQQSMSANVAALTVGGMSMVRTSRLMAIMSLAMVLAATVAGIARQDGALGAVPLPADLPPMPATAPTDPTPIPSRTIGKEPVYQNESPRYGLLAFGAEGKDRVWLVQDGNTLYVDRNGDNDLTGPGKKVAAESRRGGDPETDGYSFDVGSVTVGGKTHKGLRVYFTPVQQYASGSLGRRPDMQALLAKDPKAFVSKVYIDVDVQGMKGGGVGGRLSFIVGPTDLDGVLHFAEKPADAPVVRFGGPLQITFEGGLPTLRVGRSTELYLTVGTPGIGGGTFASLAYFATIPENAKPVAELIIPAAKAGEPAFTEKWVIEGRC